MVLVRLRVLTWNLLHGRSLPPAGHSLEAEFAAALRRWEWDVALLQEVPPWWPRELGMELNADSRMVLTSRNSLLPVRRAIARRWPDAIKSNGGGANAILARSGEIVNHRRRRLCWLPERRWVHAVELSAPGGQHVWVANLHLTVRNAEAASREAARAAQSLLGWAAGMPAVLGGDFNVDTLPVSGFELAASHNVDHIYARGLRPGGETEVPVRGLLSDHAPVAVELVD